ncbi:unnamed protein product [Sphagnum balticum]
MAGSNTPIFLGLKDIEEGIEGIEEEKSSLMLVKNFEKRFGQPPMFVASTHLDNVPQSANPGSLLKEIVHVISCSYKKLEWGKEVSSSFSIFLPLKFGWIYGSVTEDILTGFKMHCWGWRSIYCMPPWTGFKRSAPINLSHRLVQWRFVSAGISLYVFQGLLKVFAGIDTNFTFTPKCSEEVSLDEQYASKCTSFLIPPSTLLIIN